MTDNLKRYVAIVFRPQATLCLPSPGKYPTSFANPRRPYQRDRRRRQNAITCHRQQNAWEETAR